MIGIQFKSILSALTMGCIVTANAGCGADEELQHFGLHAGAPAHYLADPDGASHAYSGDSSAAETTGGEGAGSVDPTHAETRHFAIYNSYRNVVESSGSSGSGTGYSPVDVAPGDAVLWSGRLTGIDHFVCAEEGAGN